MRCHALLLSLALGLLSTSCESPASLDRAGPGAAPLAASTSAASASQHLRPPDPASVGANELGSVPVLMYHQLSSHPASVYDRTPEDFRAELERLASENYVPITAAELTSDRIDIPAGAHPVVLTFDDSTNSQVWLTATGDPAPASAVGILLDVSRRHPSFRATATFFVNNNPFSESGSKALAWLSQHGFEIGNHTLHHSNLATLNTAGVQEEIAREQTAIVTALPGLAVKSFALPYGVMPKPGALAVEGSAGGVSYHHSGVYLVGANPAPSPFSTSFDPAAIPRIRSQAAVGPEAQYCSTAWLDNLARHPADRYTSAGDPDHVTFPKSESSKLSERLLSRTRSY